MIEFPFSVAHLLNPVTIPAFLSQYYGRETLVINRNHPSHYDGLLTMHALDELIGSIGLTGDQIMVIDESRTIDPEEYLRDDESIDAVQVQRLFKDGATITLRELQLRLPTLAKLCHGAAQRFNCRFQANVYFTPPNAQGFETHHDTHDVFILQVAGSKRWRTYEAAVSAPLPGQRYHWSTPPRCRPRKAFSLRQGDLLYCPRGIPHDARSAREPSIHISLGGLVTTWTEVLLEAVADVALRDPAFRTGLPPDYATRGVAPELARAKMRDLLARLQRQVRPERILDAMADRFIYQHAALMDGQRQTLQLADSLTPDSQVGGRPGLIYRLSARRARVRLVCNSRRISLPAHVLPSLQCALETPRFRVRNLPGTLSDAAKVVLIRRLMREGLVISVAD